MSNNLGQALDLIAAAADEVVCLRHRTSHNPHPGGLSHDPDHGSGAQDGLLDHMTPDDPEWQYMLAAFCLELSRKMQYLFEGADQHRPSSAGELAQRIRSENEAVKQAFSGAPPGQQWEAMARTADRIVHQRDVDIAPRHRALLDRIAGYQSETG
jgi:hypothetical protein